ncbi:MAG: hypothetical protein E6J82_10080 [Deltaproteobacteria bacterium]|nr:MAG: hypothetical protein E6J82_10080 [Deltaproteobacteria bacterium]
MFSGVFQHSIDAKGRTSLPARFRELLLAQGADKLFITPDLIDPCLVAFAPSAWQRLAEKVAAKSMFDRDIRLLSRARGPGRGNHLGGHRGANRDLDPAAMGRGAEGGAGAGDTAGPGQAAERASLRRDRRWRKSLRETVRCWR